MDNRRFVDIVAVNYDAIVKSFRIAMAKADLPFDEDVFQDTLIKCNATYKDDTTDLEKVKAYLWMAFRTNTIKMLSRQKHMEELSSVPYLDIESEEYMVEMDEFVVMVKDELYDKFGPELSDIWLRHAAMGDTYDELKNDSPVENIHYQFKKIRKYIREELPKKNPRFRELMETLR